MTIECYAQRLLNPFRGTMHTIKYESAEAATLDGIHWDIYVANEQLLEDLNVGTWTQVSDIRYGKWSVDSGLKRGPLYPSEDFRRMEEMGATVYEHLIRVHDQVPFAFRDHYELWLLDAEGQPLALLDSVVEEKAMALDRDIDWRAGFAARDRFSSSAMAELGDAVPETLSAADYLTCYINARAGASPAAQWFLRNPDGTGAALEGIGLSQRFEGRTLGLETFPQLLISVVGHDPAHSRLIGDFLTWQAPWLLSLPGLDATARRALEQQAREQALMVFDFHRLYPEVIDREGMRAALVEAVMRRSQPMPEKEKNDTLPTYYIELNPSPTE
jgi:hypothetical protein